MAKINLPNITSGFATTIQLNTALNQIETELQNKVLYRDNPNGEPNQMENDLDMNGYDINNAGAVKINGVDVIQEMETIYNNYLSITQNVTISTAAPSNASGANGDLWFQVSS
jgi:hypothetical protein